MRRVSAYEMLGEFARIYGWGFWEWHAEMGFLARHGHASTLANDPTAEINLQIDIVWDRFSLYEFSNFEADFFDVASELNLETGEYKRLREMCEDREKCEKGARHGARAA